MKLTSKPFYINDRFFIDPSSNLFTDKINNKETRIEPRIMEVLCLLSGKANHTITREELVTVVWKDYGGGDEALTQAISAIRKLLTDTNKELIQTIPKKGYYFNARISETGEKIKPAIYKRKKWVFVAAIAAVSLIILFIFIGSVKQKDSQSNPRYSQVDFPKDHREEETERNTIITSGPDDKMYKLVMIGDQPPKFYINDTILAVDKWDPYLPLINNLKRELKSKNQ